MTGSRWIARQRLRVGFRLRGPWYTRFEIEGASYGGEGSYADDARVATFARLFPEGSKVLELGSLEGGHTFELARQGFVVTALEGRKESVRRARWLQRRLGLESVRFVAANLETTNLGELGRFDVVFCSGLLYHLPRPWELLAQLRSAAPDLFLSTHYADRAETVEHGIRGRWYQELGREDPLSGMSERSFWPTRDALLDLLRAQGYSRIEVEGDWPHPNGPLVNLAAYSGSSDGGRSR